MAAASPSFCEHPALREELLRSYPDAKLNTKLERLEGAALVDFLRGYHVALVGLEPMTAQVIDALPDLAVISKLGTGVDMLDASAMARRGIRLGWKPGANALSIAEQVIAFAILALRGLGSLNQALRRGEAPAQRMGRLLTGRVFGLHGCGHIGQEVARLLRPFGCAILAHDIADRAEVYARLGVESVPFETLLARSEVLSLHIPLNAATRGLYDGKVLDRLRADCVLINTARGELVDETALFDRLSDGRLFAACLDVFAAETRWDSPLIRLPNVFATPHVGGAAAEARLAMGRVAISGITDNFEVVPGRPPFD